MSEWKKIKISDLGKVITGNTPPRKNPELYGEHTIFIKPTDVSEEEKYTYNPDECYSELGFKKYRNSLIPKGSTCVVTIGSIGKKMTKAHCDCFINQAMNAVVANESYDEEFVFYVLKYNLVQLKTLDSGTASGRENVSKSSFSNINLLVPTEKKIQYKIGSILASYDDLIENNLKRIKLLEEIAQRTYEEWFVKFRVNGKQLIIDEKTGLPEGWELIELGSIILKLESGSRPKGGIDKSLDKGIPSVGAESVLGLGQYKYGNEKLIKSSFFDKMRRGKIENKDILIYKDGAYIGKTSMFQDEFPHKICAVNEHVFLINSGRNDIQNYLFFTLSREEYFQKMQSLNSNSAQPGINQEKIKSLELLYPNNELILLFDKVAEPLTKEIFNLAKQNQKLKESRDILLPKLMNGSINVES
jgi:type I restriction enzyme S subunit